MADRDGLEIACSSCGLTMEQSRMLASPQPAPHETYKIIAELKFRKRELETLVSDQSNTISHLRRLLAQPAVAEPCVKCGQTENSNLGEYPCSVCGLPTLWDSNDEAARKAIDAQGADLPPLPEPKAFCQEDFLGRLSEITEVKATNGMWQKYLFTIEQMQKYARKAMLSSPLPAATLGEAEGRSTPTDAEINEITMDTIGKWPSFEAQSWACKVVHAVLAQQPAASDVRDAADRLCKQASYAAQSHRTECEKEGDKVRANYWMGYADGAAVCARAVRALQSTPAVQADEEDV